MNPKLYRKAIVAALIAGLGVLGTAVLDGTVTPVEWVAIATATLAGLGITYQVPNTKP